MRLHIILAHLKKSPWSVLCPRPRQPGHLTPNPYCINKKKRKRKKKQSFLSPRTKTSHVTKQPHEPPLSTHFSPRNHAPRLHPSPPLSRFGDVVRHSRFSISQVELPQLCRDVRGVEVNRWMVRLPGHKRMPSDVVRLAPRSSSYSKPNSDLRYLSRSPEVKSRK